VLIRPARRGFTLIELMLAMVMMLIVSGAVYQLLITTQRVAAVQTEQLGMQANVRGAALVVLNELRELGTSPDGRAALNDITRIAPSAISYRASRGFSHACQTLGPGQIRIGRNHFTGHRDPQPGRDSALVYLEAPLAGPDSGWIPLGITSVSTATPCTGMAGPGITITLSGTGASEAPAAGTPIRVFERMELALYQSDGESWLGLKSVSAGEVIQPLFGPLADRDGLQLAYFDAAGRPTSVPTDVGGIAVTLRAVGRNAARPGRSPGEMVVEELSALVALRNASH
jgi:prepilin-type N-terminal cleavage/methylation domain-containing protein